ncbi:MAG: hypothetical protein AB1560_01915 [Pseudomonadota bacterium]
MQSAIHTETAIRLSRREKKSLVSFGQIANSFFMEAKGDRDKAAKKLELAVVYNTQLTELAREAIRYACYWIMVEQGRNNNSKIRRSKNPSMTKFPLAKTRRGQQIDRLYEMQLYAAGTSLGDAKREHLLRQAQAHEKLSASNLGAARGLRLLTERLTSSRARVRDVWTVEEIRAAAGKVGWKLD